MINPQKGAQMGNTARVLVAGLRNRENQITRALEKQYQCEVFWTDVESRTFESNVDLAIIVRSQINNQKMNMIKDLFKEKGKPCLITAQGFSEIKEQFENFLFERGKKAAQPEKPRSVYQIRKPFNPAIPLQALQSTPPVKSQPVVAVHETTIEIPERNMHPKETLEKIKKIVTECQQAEMSAGDTLEMLESEGLRKASGEPYDKQDIYTFRFEMKKQGYTMKPTPPPPKAATPVKVAPVAPTPAPKVVAAPATTIQTVAQKIEPMTLIAEVLKSTEMSQLEKLSLIADIQVGKVTTFNTVSKEIVTVEGVKELRISKFDIRKSRKDAVEVYLGKEHCELVLLNLDALANFAMKGTT